MEKYASRPLQKDRLKKKVLVYKKFEKRGVIEGSIKIDFTLLLDF
jgi:hypothetical protein